jgi:hypothetical protein
LFIKEQDVSSPTMNFNSVLDSALRTAGRIKRAALDRDPLISATVRGTLPGSTEPLTVQYLGRKRFLKDYFVFFERQDNVAPAADVQPMSLWMFLHRRSQISACTAGIDVTFVDDWLQPDGTHPETYAPYFNALLPVRENMDAQCNAMTSKAHRRKIQAARKRGVKWRKSTGDADFALFYDVMYAPFVSDRFGHDATTVSREHMYKVFRSRGFLLLVEENGQAVSGAFMYSAAHQPGTLFYWKYGIAHASSLDPHVFGERNAATEAVVLQYAVDNQVAMLDWGLTPAMTENGIFKHKKRVGCAFHRHAGTPNFKIVIAPDSRSRLLKAFPLVVEANGTLQVWTAERQEPLDAYAIA